MRLTKFSLLAIVFALMLISSEILVVIKQLPSKGAKPDLQSLINQHPPGWQPIAGSSVDPNTQNSTYDLVVSQIYRRADGKAASIVITWSLDGIRRAGHPQEVCYNSQGFQVSTPTNSSFMVGSQKLDVVTFTGRHGGNIEDVIYWRVTGGNHDVTIHENFLLTHRFKEVANLLIGNIPDNIMVRASTWRNSTDPPSTAHIDYIKSYLQSLDPKTRHFLTGL